MLLTATVLLTLSTEIQAADCTPMSGEALGKFEGMHHQLENLEHIEDTVQSMSPERRNILAQHWMKIQDFCAGWGIQLGKVDAQLVT